MKNSGPTIDDLKQELKQLGERYPKFGTDDLFILWFLRAYVTDREEQAAESITGVSGDKGADAIFIDDAARAVCVVQGKFRQKLAHGSEGRSAVMAFVDLVDVLSGGSDTDAEEFLSDADAGVAERLKTARRKLLKDNYRLWLYFVTTGKISSTIRKDAQNRVRQSNSYARIEIIDGRRAMLLFRDYLDGVAPPIPTLDLEMESGSGVRVNGVSQRFDESSKIESWVFSMRGDAVAALYEKCGRRLFARNIRGFMGNTAVNQGMLATLNKEPEHFFYYNNGVTIVCDAAKKESSEGRDFLQVGNPQIINGQQTTRTLASSPSNAAKGSLLVKVIRVPRDADGDGEAFEALISRIVAGTNWQNAIKPSDLMSNDRRQIELERELRKVGYLYLRKQQTKSEVRALVGNGQYRLVKKEELAQASAGCDLDPYTIRSGKEKLFTEELYPVVFPNANPDYYLPRYRLMREVTYAARGAPERSYAKWMVLNFMWSQISPLIRGKQKSRAFRTLCEQQQSEVVAPLYRAILEVFAEAKRYYWDSRGTGEEALDVSQFYKNRKNHHTRFSERWKSANSKRLDKFNRYMNKMQKAVSAFED
ncbi:MAG: AIPR family protein [Planctomycetes bacterium]|nr:AIPR family protein [Planctomycetota bacterium]